MTACTPEYLVQESGWWSGTQEDWNTLYDLALNLQSQNPLATPEDFDYYLLTLYTQN